MSELKGEDRFVLTYKWMCIVTMHKYLSQDESLFYAHVTSGAVWYLTLRKISPSQDSYFGQIMWG